MRVELRHAWSDGTTHLLFGPVELLERLAVLTPRPRINLILYHGVLPPRAAWRSQVVEHAPLPTVSEPASTEAAAPAGGRRIASSPRPGALRWADLMRRTYGFDVLACPGCGGRLRLIALIEQTRVIERILRHLGVPTERHDLGSADLDVVGGQRPPVGMGRGDDQPVRVVRSVEPAARLHRAFSD